MGALSHAHGQSWVQRWLMPMLGLATLFVGWALLCGLEVVSAAFLPSPLVVLESMLTYLRMPYAGSVLPMHLLASLEKFAISFSLAVLLGVPLGLLMGRSKLLHWIVAPVFETFRFIPPIAWVPFAILWFGTGFLSPTLVIFAGAFTPCVLNAWRGAQQIDPALIEVSHVLGAGPWRMFWEVLLPASLVHIVAGLRVAAGFGWQSLIGAELIVGSTGLGYVIVQGGSNLQPAVVMSGMVTIGLVGAGMDWGMRSVQRRVQRHWKP